ncbi:MAG: hypothetical protein ACKVE4_07255 [Dissulfuribacterales bacterium]
MRDKKLIQQGDFRHSDEFQVIFSQIKKAVISVVWPEGSVLFTIYPEKNANGVVPIKKEFMSVLVQQDWMLEHRMSIASRSRPGPIDAVKKIENNARTSRKSYKPGNDSFQRHVPSPFPE